MSKHTFPAKNADFSSYVNAATPYLLNTDNAQRLGISTEHLTDLQTVTDAWDEAYLTTQNAATDTTAAIKIRDAVRKQLETLLRDIFHGIPESVLTETDRATLNLSAHDATPTHHNKPTAAPVVSIDKITHLQHTLRFQNPETPGSHAKPDGVNAVEVYSYTGETAPAETGFTHIASTGKFLLTVNYVQADVGKTVWYLARYRSTRGEFGNWSDMVKAVIA